MTPGPNSVPSEHLEEHDISARDHVVIPNCNCPEVEMPILSSTSPMFAGFHLESGASLIVPSGMTLNIDLAGTNAVFVNEGNIENNGKITIINAAGKTVKNGHTTN